MLTISNAPGLGLTLNRAALRESEVPNENLMFAKSWFQSNQISQCLHRLQSDDGERPCSNHRVYVTAIVLSDMASIPTVDMRRAASYVTALSALKAADPQSPWMTPAHFDPFKIWKCSCGMRNRGTRAKGRSQSRYRYGDMRCSGEDRGAAVLRSADRFRAGVADPKVLSMRPAILLP